MKRQRIVPEPADDHRHEAGTFVRFFSQFATDMLGLAGTPQSKRNVIFGLLGYSLTRVEIGNCRTVADVKHAVHRMFAYC